jgi:hypothetical protein
MLAGRYRIIDPTMALFFEEGRHVAFTVPAGAIVTVENGGFDGHKLVDVTCDGKNVMMFAHDLRSRAEPIE